MARADHQWLVLGKMIRAAGDGFAYEPGILTEKLKKDQGGAPLPLRLLSIAGGLLSAVAFTAFLLISNIIRDAMSNMIAGVVFILASFLLPRWKNNLALDTFSISMLTIGLILTGMAVADVGWSDVQMSILYVAMGIITVIVTASHIQVFAGGMIFFGSLLALIFSTEWLEGIHLYNLLTIASVTFVMLYEAVAIERGGRLLWLYLPIRNAAILACFTGLMIMSVGRYASLTPRWIWLSYLPIAGSLLYFIRHLSIELISADALRQWKWMVAILLITLPTAMNPAISGALLLMLLGFYAGHRSALFLGIAGVPLFIGIWYYHLSLSLLHKSYWLMAAGLVCVAAYFLLVIKYKDDVEG
jgi:hypothetical protein